MKVIEGTYEDLRNLIYKEKFVTVKYYSEDCEKCKVLTDVFKKYSEDKKYSEILFMRMNSEENPVAKRLISEQKLPFMSSFKDGLLIESTTVSSEKEIKKVLDNLMELTNEK